MPSVRIVFLWHMHQPFYKDLVSGGYRLPWVRLHALKDYYGMVKLLDEFPGIHQTFNLVPSLVAQVQEYAAGQARDPFLEVAATPAADLTPERRRFALSYLFQANPVYMIGRYPRYYELYGRFRGAGESAERALPRFDLQDFTDLQVLSQIAWFDEYFLLDRDIAALVRKGRGFSLDDQRFVIGCERELLAKVLPAYSAAAARGAIEISTSPYYHPILPLLCDSDMGAISSPGLKLPSRRFRHAEDARTQLERGIALHERVFGLRPQGVWPSEGSVSEEVLGIAHGLGLNWMATDEGVLGRSLGFHFQRDAAGYLLPAGADKLYRIYRYEKGDVHIHLLFRDRALSDLIGFVYSGMPAQAAAQDFISRIKRAVAPVLQQGRDAVVPLILDGENAWEYYPGGGREFLRSLYAAIEREPGMRAVTVSEALREEAAAELPRQRAAVAAAGDSAAQPASGLPGADVSVKSLDRRRFGRLNSLVPGSWINANFNVWIGAPEDNRSWDYLSAARDYYANNGMTATEQQRTLAFEEVLIAEGSDWNWWYGPEHHTANDRDFDELYRKHLSNIDLALGSRPPDYLAQPIAVAKVRPTFVPQMAYIHPRIGAEFERYFDWIGAAMYTADRRAGAMHGKQFLLDSLRAGIDEENLYGRADFVSTPEGEFEMRVNLECLATGHAAPQCARTLETNVRDGAITVWKLRKSDSAVIYAVMNGSRSADVEVFLRRNFAFRIPLAQLACDPGAILRLRFSIWQEKLPLDALPLEGWLELMIVPEDELEAGLFHYSPH